MDLVMAVKKEYFDAIKSGEKTEEYRLFNSYWIKRLNHVGCRYNNIVITLGYPKKCDTEKRIVFPYVGWEKKTITHKHFGSDPVEVFAIQLTRNPRF